MANLIKMVRQAIAVALVLNFGASRTHMDDEELFRFGSDSMSIPAGCCVSLGSPKDPLEKGLH